MANDTNNLFVRLGINGDEFVNSLHRIGKEIIGLVGIMEGFQTAKRVFGDAAKTIVEFQQSVADLKAITGASKQQLDFLSDAAIQMGFSQGIAAKDTVEAYKLLASAKPELLENEQLLANTTEAAVLLSKASGLELPESIKRLTDSMNQLAIPASEANKVVDALAAGAKYSAAEIPDLSDSLLQFGSTAKGVNVNIRESVALIETLAEKGIKGAEAGTALRNILLKISAPDTLGKEAQNKLKAYGVSIETLTDKTKPLGERMNELKKIAHDTSAMVEIFRLENVNAAQALISALPRYDELLQKVGEQGVAMEQAADRTATLGHELEKLSTSWDSYVLSVENGDSVLSKFFANRIHEISNYLRLQSMLLSAEQAVAIVKDEYSKKRIQQIKTDEQYGKTEIERLQNYRKELVETMKESSGDAARSNRNQTLLAAINAETKAYYEQFTAIKKVDEAKIISDKTSEEQSFRTGDIAKLTNGLTQNLYYAERQIYNYNASLLALMETEKGLSVTQQNLNREIEDWNANTLVAPDYTVKFGDALKDSLAAGFTALGESIGYAVAGLGNFQTFAMAFVNVVSDFLVTLGKMFIAAGLAKLAFDEMLVTFGGAPLAIAAGVALIAAATAARAFMAKGIPAMADGGLVYGPSVVMTGEYSGARSNPEVIAPLDKLQSMIGGGMGGDVRFVLEGEKLVGVINKYEYRRSRTR